VYGNRFINIIVFSKIFCFPYCTDEDQKSETIVCSWKNGNSDKLAWKILQVTIIKDFENYDIDWKKKGIICWIKQYENVESSTKSCLWLKELHLMNTKVSWLLPHLWICSDFTLFLLYDWYWSKLLVVLCLNFLFS